MRRTTFSRILRNWAAAAAALAACADDGDVTSASGSTGTATSGGSSGGGEGSTDAGSTDAGSTAAPTTGTATSAATEGGSSSGEGSSGTTAAGPTDGPGVLPGETGLDAFCRRYVECGGTYYADQQACIDASLDYWGSCPSRRTALDAFGACMSEMECADWSPDAYNPGSTPCAQQWDDLGQSRACP